jgi:dihydroflavonol-4-reductase
VGFVVGVGAELRARVRGTAATLDREKVRDLVCEAWTCSPQKARDELGFVPRHTLDEGLRSTVDWYRTQGWL